jgi:hypothetical protein
MKKSLGTILVLASLTGMGFYVAYRIKKHRKLRQVADNGYETAHDVLYPGKDIKSRKVRYGPILPE